MPTTSHLIPSILFLLLLQSNGIIIIIINNNNNNNIIIPIAKSSFKTMPPKRPVTKIEPNATGAPASKRSKPTTPVIKQEPQGILSSNNDDDDDDNDKEELTLRFIALFAQDDYKDGISNTQLQSIFGNQHTRLVPIINALSQKSRINMSTMGDGDELVYTLVPEEIATKFAGLDPSARLVWVVYGVIVVVGDFFVVVVVGGGGF